MLVLNNINYLSKLSKFDLVKNLRQKFLLTIILILSNVSNVSFASEQQEIKNNDTATENSWSNNISNFWLSSKMRVNNIWQQGDYELIVPLHTHHIRHFYTREKINSYQETPYGIGIGKSYINQSGNNESIFATVFQESHFKPQYNIGYQWQKIWQNGDTSSLKFGAGYLLALVARPDPGNYFPLPGILPVLSVYYDKLSLNALYIPGGRGNGNVVFLWAKWMI